MKITTRTKLGLGWSNTPKRDQWAIKPDAEPTRFGTIKQLESELEHLVRINSGNDWTWSYYAKLGGKWMRLGAMASRDIRCEFWIYDDDGKRGAWAYELPGDYAETEY